MDFENDPVPSSEPVLLVVQKIGADRFVVVSKVNPAFAVPPEPLRIRLPPEYTVRLRTGGTVGATEAFVSSTLLKSA